MHEHPGRARARRIEQLELHFPHVAQEGPVGLGARHELAAAERAARDDGERAVGKARADQEGSERQHGHGEQSTQDPQESSHDPSLCGSRSPAGGDSRARQ